MSIITIKINLIVIAFRFQVEKLEWQTQKRLDKEYGKVAM